MNGNVKQLKLIKKATVPFVLPPNESEKVPSKEVATASSNGAISSRRSHRCRHPLSRQIAFIQLAQVGQEFVPDFLEAFGVELLASGVVDVPEGAFDGRRLGEVVEERVEDLRGHRVLVGDRFRVANLLHRLQLRVAEDL